MRNNIKQFVLLLGLLLPAAWCGVHTANSTDGHSHIHVKEGHVQGIPKGSSIQAVINGHALLVTFSENLGEVAIEVTTATGTPMDCLSTQRPLYNLAETTLIQGDCCQNLFL